MASGFFGIGGGFLIVPCLLFATTMPIIDAVGSSLLAVLPCAEKDRLRRLFALVIFAIAAYVIWRSVGALMAGR